MLVVLAVKKLLFQYQLFTKEKRHKDVTCLFVVLLMFPKFGFTPRKVVNKVSLWAF